MLSIELTCHSGHTTYWDSQPVVIRQEVVTALDTTLSMVLTLMDDDTGKVVSFAFFFFFEETLIEKIIHRKKLDWLR